MWKKQLIEYIENIDSAEFTVNEQKLIQERMEKLICDKVNNLKQNNISESVEKQASETDSPSKSYFIKYFRTLFYGRQDVFALRWSNDKTDASGYAPKCKNEWVQGKCEKGKLKGACKKCRYQEYQPLTDDIIEKHFTTTGKNAIILGMFPLLEDNTCYFLAIDFDKGNWKDAIKCVHNIAAEYNIQSYMERSRSGNGGHLWIFFTEAVEAKIARMLGTKLLETAVNRFDTLNFECFDRMFPNQDTMPTGGFGNLIALPLQRISVENQNGVFVDDDFITCKSQKNVLLNARRYTKNEVYSLLQEFPNVILQDVNDDEIQEEECNLPWVKKKAEVIPENLPKQIEIVLYDKLYISQKDLHSFLKKKFRALAVFRNPEYYQVRAMRMNLSQIPMWIQCFEENKEFLILPIGCEDPLRSICKQYDINVKTFDKRSEGTKIDVNFHGDLRDKQFTAVEQILSGSNGIIHANTAFGKTVTAIAVITERKVNTLIIVDRVQLLEQWKERLSVFLNIPKKEIGNIGGGKAKITGMIDIALCQSLVKNGEVSNEIKKYGQIIVDECHHVSAVGFEDVLKKSPARYKLGLTATLKRKDGKERIVLMQLGPVRFKDLSKVGSDIEHRVIVRETKVKLPAEMKDPQIQDVYHAILLDSMRNKMIVDDVKKALMEGKHPILLTERREHIDVFKKEFKKIENVYYLTGGLKKKELLSILNELNELPDTEQRLIIATSKFIGEGFDYPILDTMFLAMPVSWTGRIKQYAGRLHREYNEKKEILIYDYVDSDIEMAERMFARRSKGYRSMGYEIFR